MCIFLLILAIIYGRCVVSGEFSEAHEFSLYFMLPFIGVCLALLRLNWLVIT